MSTSSTSVQHKGEQKTQQTPNPSVFNLQSSVLSSESVTSHTDVGAERLREFHRAPSSVQAEFFAAIRDELEAGREFDSWLAAVEAPGPPPKFPETSLARSPVRWDQRWRQRARSARALRAAPDRRPFPGEEIEAMLKIPARVYVEALTDQDVPSYGRIACPLPDHETASANFAVFEFGWRCYGCGEAGTIYTLAARLWDLALNGPQFVELHNRLKAVLA